MARKRKKTKIRRLAGFRIPKPLVKRALSAANTRVGRVLIAEALVVAAGLLVRKNPVAMAASVGAEAADATKAVLGATGEAVSATRSVAGSASEAAANFMHAAADRLRAGVGLGDHPRKAGVDASGKRGSRSNGNVWDDLDQDGIRQALLGEFSSKKKARKAKNARRH
jgi:hypothetical protein